MDEIYKRLENIAAEICDEYCKYPDIYADKNELDQILDEVCAQCPFNRSEDVK